MNIYNWGADRCFISSLRKINLRGARGLVRRLLKQFGYENEDMNFSYSSKSGENRQSQQDLETGYSGKGRSNSQVSGLVAWLSEYAVKER